MATPFGQAGSSGPGTPFGQASGSGKAKAKSVRPTNVNKNVKVSQSEINAIKKMGMKKALASAGSSSASMQEGIRRLYGERRYQSAVNKPNGVVMGTPFAPGAGKVYGTPTTRGRSATGTYFAPGTGKTYGTPTASKKSSTTKTTTNSASKSKTTNKYGFKKNSIADKIGSSFRKAYLGK